MAHDHHVDYAVLIETRLVIDIALVVDITLVPIEREPLFASGVPVDEAVVAIRPRGRREREKREEDDSGRRCVRGSVVSCHRNR